MYLCLNRGTTGGSLPFDQFAQLAADSGFAGVDVDLGWAQKNGGADALQQMFESRKLRYGGWGAPDWRSEEQKLEEALPNFAAQADIARQLGIDSCITWIMPSSEKPFIQNWNFHVQRLSKVAVVLAERGLRFGLEFVAPYHLRRKFPHEFIYTPGLMLELADAVGPNVGLLVDCFHAYTAGTTWEHLSQIPGNRIVCAHINDAPNLPIGQIEDGNRLLPGDGAIDEIAFLKALKATGYKGPVSLEAFNCVAKLPPAEGARKAAEAGNKVFKLAGIA